MNHEREYHIDGLMSYIADGVYGTDPLESDSLSWFEIIRAAVDRLEKDQPEIEDYRQSKMVEEE